LAETWLAETPNDQAHEPIMLSEKQSPLLASYPAKYGTLIDRNAHPFFSALLLLERRQHCRGMACRK